MLAYAEGKPLNDAFGKARAQAAVSQRDKRAPPAETLDKIQKALMLGHQLLSYAETHSITEFFPITPHQVTELQSAASKYRDVVKGIGKGRREGYDTG
jgi:hypothetical protein